MGGDKLESGTKAQHGPRGMVEDVFAKLTTSGKVERRGIVPVPVEERTEKRTYSIVRRRNRLKDGTYTDRRQFTLWFTMSTNLLPYDEHARRPFRSY